MDGTHWQSVILIVFVGFHLVALLCGIWCEMCVFALPRTNKNKFKFRGPRKRYASERDDGHKPSIESVILNLAPAHQFVAHWAQLCRRRVTYNAGLSANLICLLILLLVQKEPLLDCVSYCTLTTGISTHRH